MALETASRWYFNTEWGFNSTPPEEATDCSPSRRPSATP